MQVQKMLLTTRSTLAVSLLMAMAGCSTVEGFLQGDKVDYKSQSVKTAPLEVPPDLTQLQRDGRYAPASGSVSASTYQAGGATTLNPAATSSVAVGTGRGTRLFDVSADVQAFTDAPALNHGWLLKDGDVILFKFNV